MIILLTASILINIILTIYLIMLYSDYMKNYKAYLKMNKSWIDLYKLKDEQVQLYKEMADEAIGNFKKLKIEYENQIN